MLSLDLALALHDAGLTWAPAPGDAFVSLERLTGDPSGYAVTVAGAGEPVRHVDVTAEAAYARAVLAMLPGPR